MRWTYGKPTPCHQPLPPMFALSMANTVVVELNVVTIPTTDTEVLSHNNNNK